MPLMPLPFGNKIAKRYSSLAHASDAMSEILFGLERLDAPESLRFRSKMDTRNNHHFAGVISRAAAIAARDAN